MNLRSTITSSVLAIAGIGLWSYAGHKLNQEGAFTYDPNPLGIKRSPYGQVVAMAIQAPIDADWHSANRGRMTADGDVAKNAPVAEPHHDHSNCTHEDCGSLAHSSAPQSSSLSLVKKLEKIASERTNPHPPTPAHNLYLRREIEKRLRFAYNLDPSHYGNYNTLYLFLTEPQVGTQESYTQGRKTADELALHTLRYCLQEKNDPRPALTAVTAAYNILEGMFLDPEERYTVAQMRQQLQIVDFCLQQHFKLMENAKNNGTWNLLSDFRKSEILDRSMFALKLRDAAEKGIIRRESPDSATANHEPS